MSYSPYPSPLGFLKYLCSSKNLVWRTANFWLLFTCGSLNLPNRIFEVAMTWLPPKMLFFCPHRWFTEILFRLYTMGSKVFWSHSWFLITLLMNSQQIFLWFKVLLKRSFEIVGKYSMQYLFIRNWLISMININPTQLHYHVAHAGYKYLCLPLLFITLILEVEQARPM